MQSKITNKLNKQTTAVHAHIWGGEKANIMKWVNIESGHYYTLAIF